MSIMSAQASPDSTAAYLAEAREAIATITATGLKLSRGGFVLDEDREHAQGPDFVPECVATALAFLDRGPISRVSPGDRRAVGSYGCKHAAENWGREHGLEPYVSNGDLILAAIWRGIKYARDPGGSPNCRLGLRYLSRRRHRSWGAS